MSLVSWWVFRLVICPFDRLIWFIYVKELLEKLEHIKTLSCLLSRLLEKAERSVQQSLEGFVSDEVRQLGSAIGGYFKCFDAFNVKTRTALEAKWSECYQCQEIRDTVEYLLEVEENWNAFLEKVDRMLNGGAVNEVKVTAGAGAPCEVPLIDVTTNR